MAVATLFGALGTGVSGLFVSRAATNIINHNIANANTPGYSRQYLDIRTAVPIQARFGLLGRGAAAGGIDRVTDRFVEANLFRQTSLLGTYVSIDDSLRNVESILGGVENDRLGEAMNAFFDAYSELASAPEDTGRRENVIRRAEALAFNFRDIAAELVSQRREIEQRLQAQVKDANALLQQVAVLNSEVLQAGAATGSANDLIDRRNLLLNQLSELVDVSTVERSDGSLDVIVQGRTLVTRNVAQLLEIDTGLQPDGTPTYKLVTGKGGVLDLPLQSGSVAGLVRMGNEIIPDILADLDALALTVMERVNALHREGVTTGGGGLDLFTGTGAADFGVTTGIVLDPSLLATGRSGEAGDNEIADAIAGLRDTPSEDGRTLNDVYLELLVGVSTERGTFQTLRDGQISVVESVAARLEETRGVNVDEELAYLLQYQRSYEASARVIRSVDEMLDTLINRMI